MLLLAWSEEGWEGGEMEGVARGGLWLVAHFTARYARTTMRVMQRSAGERGPATRADSQREEQGGNEEDHVSRTRLTMARNGGDQAAEGRG